MAKISTVEDAKLRLDQDIAKAHEVYKKRIANIEAMQTRQPPKPGKSNAPRDFSRYDLALSLRKSGKTFRQVGQELGVSVSHARMMTKMAERYASDAEENPNVKELSGRSFRRIRSILGTYSFSAEDVASSVTAKQLEEGTSFGPWSVNEVRLWLRRNGLDLRHE